LVAKPVAKDAIGWVNAVHPKFDFPRACRLGTVAPMAKRLTQSQLQPEVDRWVSEGVIQPAQAASIVARYPVADGVGRMMTIFIALGAVLIVGGIALVISSNWKDIPPLVKMAGLLLLLAAATVAGIEAKSRGWARGWWEGAFSVSAILPLLGIALISQIFHLSGKATGLFLGWTLLIVVVPVLTRSVGAFVVLLCALFALQQAWLNDYVQAWLVGSTDRWGNFALQILGAAVFGLVCAAVSTGWKWLGETVQARAGEYMGLLVFLVASYFYGFETKPFDTRPAWPFVWLIVFVLAVLVIYRAVRTGNRTHQVNLGFVIIGLVIISTYVRLVGTMMNTGVIFLTGGALMLACAFVLARWRRRLLTARPAPVS
jgi:uncharacterized membrane protein